MTSQNESEFRLPLEVVPVRYDLTLRPDLKSFLFTGTEAINVEVKKPVSSIKINAVDIQFGDVYIESKSGTRLIATVSIDKETELATLAFDGFVGAGEWTLHIDFTGELSEQLQGFYRSFWTDSDNQEHVIASTHFEPTHARRAFPCFDEPAFKATFKIALEVEKHLNAISNEVIVSESVIDSVDQSDPELKRIEFAETMKMSTYLVAFCVGDFVSSDVVNVNGTEVRIWCTPGKEHLTKFPLEIACFAVDFYESYFEIPYPGKKIDHIAIPDFPIGAMENLGCITFRESALLINPEKASHVNLVRVADIVAHELAHMWFGDLVTMRWWNGLWLKESFATFMASMCVDAWRPHWRMWDGFSTSRAAALFTDALQSTHAIENSVNHPDEASEMFDVISYQKGCSVLYQLHEFLGAETFRKGCVAYLRKHQYGNTETHDLWDALEEACRDAGDQTEVRELMDAWVFDLGHPEVHVRESHTPGLIELSQRKFQFLPEAKMWKLPIPLIMRIVRVDGTIERKKFVMNKFDQTVEVGDDVKAIVVNSGGSGCYRVTYSRELTNKLIEAGLENLTVVERFNLVNDLWTAARAARMDVGQFIEIAQHLTFENEPTIWEKLAGALGSLHRMSDEDGQKHLQAKIRELTSQQVKRLGWETRDDDSGEDQKVRSLLLDLLGTIGGDQSVIARARDWFENVSVLDPEMVPAVVSVVAYNGGDDEFEDILSRYKTASTPQEEMMYLFALAEFREEKLLARTIDMCLSKEVRAQNASNLFSACVRNENGRRQAWEFFKARHNDMQRAYPSIAMGRLCQSFSIADTDDEAQDINDFFAKTKIKAVDTAVKQMLELLRVNVLFKTRVRLHLKKQLVG